MTPKYFAIALVLGINEKGRALSDRIENHLTVESSSVPNI